MTIQRQVPDEKYLRSLLNVINGFMTGIQKDQQILDIHNKEEARRLLSFFNNEYATYKASLSNNTQKDLENLYEKYMTLIVVLDRIDELKVKQKFSKQEERVAISQQLRRLQQLTPQIYKSDTIPMDMSRSILTPSNGGFVSNLFKWKKGTTPQQTVAPKKPQQRTQIPPPTTQGKPPKEGGLFTDFFIWPGSTKPVIQQNKPGGSQQKVSQGKNQQPQVPIVAGGQGSQQPVVSQGKNPPIVAGGQGSQQPVVSQSKQKTIQQQQKQKTASQIKQQQQLSQQQLSQIKGAVIKGGQKQVGAPQVKKPFSQQQLLQIPGAVATGKGNQQPVAQGKGKPQQQQQQALKYF